MFDTELRAAHASERAVEVNCWRIEPSRYTIPFRGRPDWVQALGKAIPVTRFMRVVRRSLLKGAGLENAGPSLLALGLFELAVLRC